MLRATMTVALVGGALLAQPVVAQGYPTKAVRMIVPLVPGGSVDTMARALAQKMTESMGQQVVVDNRGGASGNIGTEIAARAPADGYTLLTVSMTLVVNQFLFPKVPYDAVRDFAPVSLIAAAPLVLTVHPSLPVKSVPEFIALARKQPGAINVGSAGIGTSPHLSLELLTHLAKISVVHVAYKGSGNATIANLAGEVSAQIPSLPTAMNHLKSGRLRALGVTTEKRSPYLSEVPAIGESVPGYEATQWFGLLAPAGTPQPVLERLSQDALRALKAPDLTKVMAAEGAQIVASSPAQFAAYMRSETEKWGRVIKAAGIKPQ